MGVCGLCVVCVARGCSVYDADILSLCLSSVSLLSLFCFSLSLSHTRTHLIISPPLKVVVQDQKFKPQSFLASGCLEINDGSSFIMMKKGCDEDGTFRVEVLYMS